MRTRDPAVIDQQAVVVDVGGVYDPSKYFIHIAVVTIL